VFSAPNFSRGVALMAWLAAEAAKRLPGWDAAVVETHHTGKKDAPSGTALRLAQAVRDGRGSAEKVEIASVRLSDVAGDHELIFGGPFERLSLVHRAESRDVFALGALEAAVWVAKKKPGLYGMNDLLGLK
jgi:4-hydroxy-tetrahydrodipicolinate reductase